MAVICQYRGGTDLCAGYRTGAGPPALVEPDERKHFFAIWLTSLSGKKAWEPRPKQVPAGAETWAAEPDEADA